MMPNFIPKPEKSEVISLRLNSELVHELDKLSQQNHMSRNKFIAQCIEFALKNLQSDESN